MTVVPIFRYSYDCTVVAFVEAGSGELQGAYKSDCAHWSSRGPLYLVHVQLRNRSWIQVAFRLEEIELVDTDGTAHPAMELEGEAGWETLLPGIVAIGGVGSIQGNTVDGWLAFDAGHGYAISSLMFEAIDYPPLMIRFEGPSRSFLPGG